MVSATDATATQYAEGARKVTADEVATPFQNEIREATSKRDGLSFELRMVAENDLEDAMEDANKDDSVHGIMIYYPVFGQRPSFHGASHDDYLRDSVSPYKDVEGLCHFYRRSLYRNRRYVDDAGTKKCVLPCTPLAVVKALEHLQVYDSNLPMGDRMRGKIVTVVNRSEVVGRPLAAMLANDGATVYSVDIDSVYTYLRGKLQVPPEEETTETLVRRSDIVILGVPSNNYKLNPSWVKEGAIVINVASHKNIDEEALLTTRPGVRYIPQVGKITVSMLERNLLRLFDNWSQTSAAKMSSDAAMLAMCMN